MKDLKASQAFYAKLGFESAGGDPAQNWLILRNGNVTVGLFQGMFEKNMLTFNPGWDEKAQPVPEFTDVREHQRRLKAQGLKLQTEADPESKGPASLVLVDPDGNPPDRPTRLGESQAFQGFTSATPQPAKSAMLRVAIVAPVDRAIAAICASKCEIGRPAPRLSDAI